MKEVQKKEETKVKKRKEDLGTRIRASSHLNDFKFKKITCY